MVDRIRADIRIPVAHFQWVEADKLPQRRTQVASTQMHQVVAVRRLTTEAVAGLWRAVRAETLTIRLYEGISASSASLRFNSSAFIQTVRKPLRTVLQPSANRLNNPAPSEWLAPTSRKSGQMFAQMFTLSIAFCGSIELKVERGKLKVRSDEWSVISGQSGVRARTRLCMYEMTPSPQVVG
jgi:hypothetical protein